MLTAIQFYNQFCLKTIKINTWAWTEKDLHQQAQKSIDTLK